MKRKHSTDEENHQSTSKETRKVDPSEDTVVSSETREVMESPKVFQR